MLKQWKIMDKFRLSIIWSHYHDCRTLFWLDQWWLDVQQPTGGVSRSGRSSLPRDGGDSAARCMEKIEASFRNKNLLAKALQRSSSWFQGVLPNSTIYVFLEDGSSMPPASEKRITHSQPHLLPRGSGRRIYWGGLQRLCCSDFLQGPQAPQHHRTAQ